MTFLASTASDAFLELLKAPVVNLCRVWEIVPVAGDTLRYTNHDEDIVVDGQTYITTSTFRASATAQRLGMSVDNLSLEVLYSDDLTEEQVLAGYFGDAEVQISLAIWDRPDVGLMPIKRGYVGEVQGHTPYFTVELRGLMDRLQRPVGRTYGTLCDAEFGDSRCGVDLAPYTHDTTIIGYTSKRIGVDVGLGDTYFRYGTIEFTSGPNVGRKYDVLQDSEINGKNWIRVPEPIPFALSVGDNVRLVRGCPHTAFACRTLFNNMPDFRGFPHIPTERRALQTPRAR